MNNAPTSSAFVQIKRQMLEDQRQALLEEYQAANAQLARTLSDVDRVRLERQLRDLEQQITKTEADLAALDHPLANKRQQPAVRRQATHSPPASAGTWSRNTANCSAGTTR
jgi:predicted  nucleic acid-binding Zn-ribbon protein